MNERLHEKGPAGFVVAPHQPSPFRTTTPNVDRERYRPSTSRFEGTVSREEIQRSLFGKVRKQRTLEAPVLKAAMDYLNSIRGCHVWRQNTGWKPWYDTNGKRHVVYYGQKGQGDITGLTDSEEGFGG